MSAPDAGLQAAFAKMLQSPSQMRRVLAAVAAQTPSTPTTEEVPAHANVQPVPDLPPTSISEPSSELLPYASTAFTRNYNNSNPPSPATNGPTTPGPYVPQPQDLITSHNLNEQRLQRTYSDTEEITADVDKLDQSINSLIQSLGLDPNTNFAQDQGGQGWGDHGMGMDGNIGGGGMDDFDLDAFLNDMSHQPTDANSNMAPPGSAYDFGGIADRLDASTSTMNKPTQEQFGAFLDDVTEHDHASNSSAGELLTMPPVEVPEPIPLAQQKTRAQGHLKRKSGTAGMDEPTAIPQKPASKSKRKR